MTGKDFYKDTFNEIQVSDYMITKLMLLNGSSLNDMKRRGVLYHVAAAIITFVCTLLASGTLFTVPLL